MVERFKAWFCRLLFAGIALSNHAEEVDVCLVAIVCVVR